MLLLEKLCDNYLCRGWEKFKAVATVLLWDCGKSDGVTILIHNKTGATKLVIAWLHLLVLNLFCKK